MVSIIGWNGQKNFKLPSVIFSQNIECTAKSITQLKGEKMNS